MCPGPRIIPGMLFRVKYVRSVPAQYGAGDAEVPRAVLAADSAATASGCSVSRNTGSWPTRAEMSTFRLG